MKFLVIVIILGGLVYLGYKFLESTFEMVACPACNGQGEVVNLVMNPSGIPVKCNWCNGIAKVFPDDAKQIQQKLTATGKIEMKKPPVASSTAVPVPTSIANTPISASSQGPFEVVTCARDVEAFSPANPAQPIGKFLTGSELNVEKKDSSSGKVFVTYTQENGSIVQALCRAEDLGK